MKTKISNPSRKRTKSDILAFWGSVIGGGIGGAIFGFHAKAVLGAIAGLLLGSFFLLFYVYALLMNDDRRVRLLFFFVLITVAIYFKFRLEKIPEIGVFSCLISFAIWIYGSIIFAIFCKIRRLWFQERSAATKDLRIKRFIDQFTRWLLTAEIHIGSLPVPSFVRKREEQIERPIERPTLFTCPFCNRRSELDEFDYDTLTEVIQHSCGFTLDEGLLKERIKEEKIERIEEDYWSKGRN
jgi:hypothetical protein